MTLIYVCLAFIIILLILIIISIKKAKDEEQLREIRLKVEGFSKEIDRVEGSVKSEIAANRRETSENARTAREELGGSLKNFGELITSTMAASSSLQKDQLESFSGNLQNLTKSIEGKLSALTSTIDIKLQESNEGNALNSKESRNELRESLDSFRKDFSQSVQDFNKMQTENFHTLLQKQTDQNLSTAGRLDLMRETLERKMGELQMGNEKKLDEMRATVDEKLQKTLETRLGDSFKLVSERLEAVHKGLGDMQQLATGVGDLKKVLTNVKSRGVLGEYQLENILEQILTTDQYGKNVKTKEGSSAVVEFAIKLPGREDKGRVLWLPVDSKFPKEAFEHLMEAYDNGTPESIEERRKAFVKGIKLCALEICSKYIDPPNTTDFALLFLPFESLYAEVLRTPGLFESLQRECKIHVVGPTTLSAFLSSLQIGFRTLVIEKRSSEVWELLGAVKTEFGNFGGILEKTQKKLQEASNVIEKAGVRSRSIEKRLKLVQELPKQQATALLNDTIDLNELPEIVEEENGDEEL